MAKANKKQALGRGLSAILGAGDKKPLVNESRELPKGINEIEISKIEVNPFQPRTNFDSEALSELKESISQLGLIQPITIRQKEDGNYELVSGERRLRATTSLGWTQIPAYVRKANDNEMLEMALVENIQRQDLDPIEVALSFQRLIDEVNLTQEELSKRVGKKRPTISNYLRLLKLDPIIQSGLRDGFLTMGHGRALMALESIEDQLSFYELIAKENLSVHQTEEIIKEFKNTPETTPLEEEKKSNKGSDKTQNNFDELKDQLSKYYGRKITIKVGQKGKGQVNIPFNSEQDLNKLFNLLKSE